MERAVWQTDKSRRAFLYPSIYLFIYLFTYALSICLSTCLSVWSKPKQRAPRGRPTGAPARSGGRCGGRGALQALGEHSGLFLLLVWVRAACRFTPAEHSQVVRLAK